MIKFLNKTACRGMIVFLLMCIFAQPAFSASSPLPMMKRLAQNMITALKRNQSRLAGNVALVRRIVNRVLIPHVDLYSMAGRVVGRAYWLQATPAERSQFTQLFKRRIINTYAAALASYNGDRVLFYPMRSTQGTYAQVRSLIVRPNGQRIPVNYSLRYASGRWRIIDFSVESVSMVNNYKAQYSGTLSQGGLKKLIMQIKKR